MKIGHGKDLEFKVNVGNHRGGKNSGKNLLYGEPGALDNYGLSIGKPGGNAPPRHRHNFEQFRFALQGPCNYGPNQDIPEGWLGYFPEGAFYGPFQMAVGTLFVSLQFGGPCGEGWEAYPVWKTATEELNERGRFEDGIYLSTNESGKETRQDAFEAIWEHVRGRKITYPKPRYAEPVMIDPEAFAWIPVEDAPGVAQRHLGTFTERNVSAGMIKLDAGSTLQLPRSSQIRLYFVRNGSLVVNDDEKLERGSAFEAEKHVDEPRLEAIEDCVLLTFTLPHFA
jgi:hypothetical protein